MSQRKGRRRRSRGGAATAEPQEQQGGGQPQGQQQREPGANWNWRTFPVYFAFALGMFVGLYLGLLAYAADEGGDGWFTTGIFIAVAIMLGLGLSRITTNWLVRRRFIKARGQQKKR